MKIYNSLTKRKEEFEPIEAGKVKMYACGITVSGEAHIGHAYQALIYDIMRKYLQKLGYRVTYARNYTDVDDKIIAKSKETGIPADVYAAEMIGKIDEVMRKFRVDDPDVWLKATENIGNILSFIAELIEKGHAYATKKGDVYFDVDTYPAYGHLSNRNIEDALDGVRVDNDDEKKNAYDFALWKSAKEGEICWDSPWGKGRPGWHIECSGISMKHLGEDLDIHCGGIDNAFPHHTNEIAQSESYLGHHWCNWWVHVLHLNTTSGKMSKSSGEFLTVSLLQEKGYDPLVYRLFCLQSHYRKSLVFSWENLDNAAGAYQKLIARIAALKPGDGEVDAEAQAALREKFRTALDNDLNTSLAVTALYDVLKYKTNDATKLSLLGEFDQVLSLSLLEKAEEKRQEAAKTSTSTAGGYTVTGEGDSAIDALVLQRGEAKKAKNFAEADRIRDELKAQGIEITDVPGGAVWKRV